MLFTSYSYVLFLLVATIVHWSLPQTWRNPMLVVASFVFYCSWDWHHGFLLAALAVFNWAVGRWIVARNVSMGLMIGVCGNVGCLLYFKYAGFLVWNIDHVLSWSGSALHLRLWDIALPLGISFFTFQGVAYVVDVAAGQPPLTSLMDFLVFKTLWPQLIAGPIVRLEEMREQIEKPRHLDMDRVRNGGRRILFGFVKKCVLADTIAPFVDQAFLPGVTPGFVDAVFGVIGFGLQIYLDFSAYSDIALGSAELLGFRLPENFEWPYAASSPRDFWERWHMSLSRWIRDYVFNPLAFSLRRKPGAQFVSLLVAMALCGLWHGARWTFVLWGVWHGALLLAYQGIFKRVWARPKPLVAAWGAVLTFVAVQAGWVLFRSESLAQAGAFFSTLVSMRGGLHPTVMRETAILLISLLFVGTIAATFLRRRLRRLGQLWQAAPPLRGLAYTVLLVAVIVFDPKARAFVYFQF